MLDSASRSIYVPRRETRDLTHGDQWTLAKSVDPILIPEETEKVSIQAGCEDLDVKLVILVRMYTKVLNLVERDRLIFGRRSVGWRVVLWICAESANVYLTGGDGAIGVDLYAIRPIGW